MMSTSFYHSVMLCKKSNHAESEQITHKFPYSKFSYVPSLISFRCHIVHYMFITDPVETKLIFKYIHKRDLKLLFLRQF